MLTFREFFLLSEQPNILFDEPVQITVNLEGQPQRFTVDMIDVRAEDWNATQVRTADGVVMQSAPKAISSFQPYSLPLADGQFINHDAFGGNTIGPEATSRTIVRKDWANFAQFLMNDKVIKNPSAIRSNDMRAAV